MSTVVTAEAVPGAATARRRPAAPVLVVLALVVGLVPYAVSAVQLALHHGGIALGGDQAVLELATRDAEHVSRSLGAYSRYGWSHPGPFWFYLLAPVYALLGSTSAGLVAAVLAVHAAAVVLLVLVTARWWGPGRALALTSGTTAAWAVLGPSVFSAVWNPYALLLPTVLLLLLTGAAAAGRPAALGGAAVVGSFLVQTHVGTVVLVAATGAVAVVGLASDVLRRRRQGTGRAGGWWTGLALAVVAALAWVPPLVQEARPGTGNLTLLELWQRSPHSGHGVREALAALGSELLVLPSGGRAAALPDAAAHLGGLQVLALLLALALPVLLALVAWRAGRPLTAGLAVVSLAAVLAAAYSVRQVEGTLYPYLVIWEVVLPLGPALCLADLLLAAVQRPSARWVRGVSLALAPVVPVLALVVAAVVLDGAPPASAASRYGVAAALPEVLPAVATPSAGQVRVRIDTSDTWPLASGLVLALDRRGYDARVTADWTFMFGPERGSTGTEPRELLLVDDAGLPPVASLPDTRVLGTVDEDGTAVHVLLRDPPGNAPVPVLPGPVTGKAPAP